MGDLRRKDITVQRFRLLLITSCLLLAACGTEPALEWTKVDTLAGSGRIGPLGGGYADGPALEAEFHDPKPVNDSMTIQTAVAGGGTPSSDESL